MLKLGASAVSLTGVVLVATCPIYAQEAPNSAVHPAYGQDAGPAHSSGAKPAHIFRSDEIPSQRFDDWTLSCSPIGGKPDPIHCQVALSKDVQLERRAPYLVNLIFSLASDKTGNTKWMMLALSPLGVDLAAGLQLVAGKGSLQTLSYRYCVDVGCAAVGLLDSEFRAVLRNEDKASVSFRLTDGKTVNVAFSLKGFAAATDRLASGKDLPRAVDAEPKP